MKPFSSEESQEIHRSNAGLQVMNVGGPDFLLLHHTQKLPVLWANCAGLYVWGRKSLRYS